MYKKAELAGVLNISVRTVSRMDKDLTSEHFNLIEYIGSKNYWICPYIEREGFYKI